MAEGVLVFDPDERLDATLVGPLPSATVRFDQRLDFIVFDDGVTLTTELSLGDRTDVLVFDAGTFQASAEVRETIDVLVFDAGVSRKVVLEPNEHQDLVVITPGGPPGPPGPQGPPGVPGGDFTLPEVQAIVHEHAIATTNVHGIQDTSQLVTDNIPDLTLIFENGLI